MCKCTNHASMILCLRCLNCYESGEIRADTALEQHPTITNGSKSNLLFIRVVSGLLNPTHDIMSASEREQAKLTHREQRIMSSAHDMKSASGNKRQIPIMSYAHEMMMPQEKERAMNED